MRRRWPLLVVLSLLLPGAGASVEAADPLDPVLGTPGTTLPDLVPDVPFFLIQRPSVFDEATQTTVPGPPVLHFETWVQNVGAVALQLTIDEPDDADLSSVSQCVSWRADHLCREQRVVDGLAWRSAASRFRLDGFASHELRRVLPGGRVDSSKHGFVAARRRTGLCPHDFSRVHEHGPAAPFYVHCTQALTGVSSGWTDLYDFGEREQQFPISALEDGRYALVVRIDTLNRIHEVDDGNNVVEVIFDIANGATEVSIVDRHYP